ncbi:MAG: MG2 domain-containing protein, partial [Blastocatellia bacterium]
MFSVKLRPRLATIAVYTGVAAIALAFATATLRAADENQAQPAAAPDAQKVVKPFFQLSTNHTYGTTDKARVWVTYQGIDHLDFRVYKVSDPVQFFKQLNDPHQMGEREKTEVAQTYNEEKPSPLEKVRSVKVSIFRRIKDYLRDQLHPATRQVMVEKFHGEDRLPLNVADYAQVPLLNSNQLIGSWRELLAKPETDSDTRFVALGKQGPGVYLVEAVNEGLRAYTVAVVTDMTMVTKTAPGGGVLVYTVDRKSGKPQSGAQVIAVNGGKTLATGSTDQSGILKTKIQLDKAAQKQAQEGDEEGEEGDQDADQSKVGANSYLLMASNKGNFAISDLQPFYFRSGNGGGTVGYIYTDRPIYRPGQTVYFKGIVRQFGENGYELPSDKTVSLTIQDPNGTKMFDKDLQLSPRGTFSGQVDVAGGAPLGSYQISAKIAGDTQNGSFEVQEYKKPEYKVTVTTPKQFVKVGQKTSFTVNAKYFFGAPVTKADVQYYIYRSRYYSWWWADEDSDDLGDSSQSDEDAGEGDSYGYGTDMVKDGKGVLDANGNLTVEFEVPQPEEKDPTDYNYRLEAQVTDSARRMIQGSANLIGVRGNVVADASTDRYVYYQGDTAKVRVRTSTYEGKPISSTITLKFVHRTWDKIDKGGNDKSTQYEYKLRETEMGSADVTTDSQGQGSYNYNVPAVGDFYIKAIVHDGNNQYLSNGGWMWVADKSDRWADFSFEDNSQIKLIPDKKSYQPGETAHVLAMLPTDGA